MTRVVAVLAGLLLVGLAGCVQPIPDDAVRAVIDDFPGPELYLWNVDRGENIVFFGRLVNGGDRNIMVNQGSFPNPWEFSLRNETGESLSFHNRLHDVGAAYNFIGPGDHFDFKFSWGKVVFDGEETQDAPPGNYTFTLGVAVHQDRASKYVGTPEAVLRFVIT